MKQIMVSGAGKIGSLIAFLLANSKSYQVHLADLNFCGDDVARLLAKMPNIKTVALDVTCEQSLEDYLKRHRIDALVSSLPFFLNAHVARAAKAVGVHYFDLTEDVAVTKLIKELAEGADVAFVPQCGLAPGFTGIVANSLIQEFEDCHTLKLRVGALPQRASNALHYALTWSTDGLINAYANPCHAIEDGKSVLLPPLEGLEVLDIDGSVYEAFNTSGGLGSLTEIYPNSCKSMNYKTIRYPGHCEKMRFLMKDLHLNEDRPTFKRILEQALPKTYQDVVIIYVMIEGIDKGNLTEKSYLKKIYPENIGGLTWSAIQVSTAAGLCCVLDLVFKHQCKGLVYQEKFQLTEVLKNRFGSYFA